jgi:hypothetical protein
MTSIAETPHDYDPRTPRTTHNGLTAGLYGEILAPAETVLNVGAGYTDLGADLRLQHITKPVVTSLDAMEGYGPSSLDGRPDKVHGYAQDLPFEDNSFSMSVCHFAAQHMPNDVLGAALKEMVRVTEPAENSRDATKGVVMVGPVFKKKGLEEEIEKQGLGMFVGLTMHEGGGRTVEGRKYAAKPSLWIHKLEELTPDKLSALTTLVVNSEALKTTRTVSERLVRLFGGASLR